MLLIGRNYWFEVYCEFHLMGEKEGWRHGIEVAVLAAFMDDTGLAPSSKT